MKRLICIISILIVALSIKKASSIKVSLETLVLSIVESDCIEVEGNSSIIYLIEDMIPTSLSSRPFEPIINIFPNPANRLISIESNSSLFDLRILDMTGKIMKFHPNKNRTSNIDISFLPKGMYIVELTNSSTDEKRIGRIIKE